MNPQNGAEGSSNAGSAGASSTSNNSGASSASGTSVSAESLKSNKKLVETVKIFVIYGTIVWVAGALLGMVLSFMSLSAYSSSFSAGVLIGVVIFGAIGSAICGVLFYYLYEPVHNWIKRNGFLSKHITNMFTLFWKPFLVGTVIEAIFSLLAILVFGTALSGVGVPAIGFVGLFIGWIITLAVRIVIYYYYSKMISAKLVAHYPW